MLAALFGLSSVADAFFLGFLIPNLFRRLFGEGALTAAFLPPYARLRQTHPRAAGAFATRTVLLLIGVGMALAVAAALALSIPALTERLDDKADLALNLTRVMILYAPLVCGAALIAAVLQTAGRFVVPAVSPVILNGAMIAAALAWSSRAPEQAAMAIAVGVVAAGVIQTGLHLLAARKDLGSRHAVRQDPVAQTALRDASRTTRRTLAPIVLGLAVFQINALLDALLAFVFSPPQELSTDAASAAGVSGGAPGGGGASGGGGTSGGGPLGLPVEHPVRVGAVAALQWAQRLYQFPLGVFGIAIATAIFPALAKAVRKPDESQTNQNGNRADFRGQPGPDFLPTLRQGLRLTLFIGLPASAGLLLVRTPLVRVIYEHGIFTAEDTGRVAALLAAYGASVWAYSLIHVLTRAFYALGEPKTPVKAAVAAVGLNLALNLTLIWPLGALGLALSTAISAAFQAVLLAVWLQRRLRRSGVIQNDGAASEPNGSMINASVRRSWGRSLLATAVMGLVIGLAPLALGVDPTAGSFAHAVALLAGQAVAGAGVYFAFAGLGRWEELRWLLRRGG
ncbi:MAG: murein biosynthesis integral membrane protein MurJ [Planctomycetota bacterium]